MFEGMSVDDGMLAFLIKLIEEFDVEVRKISIKTSNIPHILPKEEIHPKTFKNIPGMI